MNAIVAKFVGLIIIAVILALFLPFGPFSYLWYGDGTAENSQAPAWGVWVILGVYVFGAIAFIKLMMSLFNSGQGESEIDSPEANEATDKMNIDRYTKS